jgi:carbon storage regulator
MLVLTRKLREEIVVPGCDLVITILEVHGDKVSIGITAPRDVKVYRREVWRRITAAQEAADRAALDQETVARPATAGPPDGTAVLSVAAAPAS